MIESAAFVFFVAAIMYVIYRSVRYDDLGPKKPPKFSPPRPPVVPPQDRRTP